MESSELSSAPPASHAPADVQRGEDGSDRAADPAAGDGAGASDAPPQGVESQHRPAPAKRTYGRRHPSAERDREDEAPGLLEEHDHDDDEDAAQAKRKRVIPSSSSSGILNRVNINEDRAGSSSQSAATSASADAHRLASSPSPRKRQRSSSGQETAETTATTLPAASSQASDDKPVPRRAVYDEEDDAGFDATVKRRKEQLTSSELSSLPTSMQPAQSSDSNPPVQLGRGPASSTAKGKSRRVDASSGDEEETEDALMQFLPVAPKGNTVAGKMKARNGGAPPRRATEPARISPDRQIARRAISEDEDEEPILSDGSDRRSDRAAQSKADKLKALAERRRREAALAETEAELLQSIGASTKAPRPSTSFKPAAAAPPPPTHSRVKQPASEDEEDELEDDDDINLDSGNGSDSDDDRVPDMADAIVLKRPSARELEMQARFEADRAAGKTYKGDERRKTRMLPDGADEDATSESDAGSDAGAEKSTRRRSRSTRKKARKPKPLTAKDKEEMQKATDRLQRADKIGKAKAAYEAQASERAVPIFGISAMQKRIKANDEARKRGVPVGLHGLGLVTGAALGLAPVRNPHGVDPSDPIEEFEGSQRESKTAKRRISPVDGQRSRAGSAGPSSRPLQAKEIFTSSDGDASPAGARMQPSAMVNDLLQQHQEEAERKRKAMMEWRARKEAMLAQQQQKLSSPAAAPPVAVDGKLPATQEAGERHARSPLAGSSSHAAPRREDVDSTKGARGMLFTKEIAVASAAVDAPAVPARVAPAAPAAKRKGKDADAVTNTSLNLELQQRMRMQNRKKRTEQATLAAKKGVRALKAYDPNERVVHATAEEIEQAHQAVGDGGDDNDDDDEEDAEDSDYDAGSAYSGEEKRAERGSASEREDEPDEEEDNSEKENDPPPGSMPGSQHSLRSAKVSRADAEAADQEDDEDSGPVRAKHQRAAVASDDDEPRSALAASQGSNRSRRSILGPLMVQPVEEQLNAEDEELEAPTPAQEAPSTSQLMPPPPIIETQRPAPAVSTASDASGAAPSADDVFGRFFADTQQSQVKSFDAGPSAPVARQPSSVLGTNGVDAGGGFSQFFQETQVAGEVEEQETDAFAALRHQSGEQDLFAGDAVLPTIDTADAERYEAEADEAEQRYLQEQRRAMLDTPKQYLNKHGLYTQTKPSAQSQALESQSQDWLGATPKHSFFESIDAEQESVKNDSPSKASEQPGRKRRFRLGKRTPTPEQSPVEAAEHARDANDGKAATGEDAEDHSEVDPESASEPEDADEQEEEEADSAPAYKPLNAFSALMAGAAAAARPAAPEKIDIRKRKSAYVEGEAAEDSDEDIGGLLSKKRKGGALQGVFSDDEGGDDEEEDSDDDGDAKDIEGLVDDVREVDEADKDELMRQKAKAQQAEDDAAVEKKLTRITEGKWRHGNKNGNAMDNALDEDADDADDLRRVQMPGFHRAHKRVVDGEDGLEALKAIPEAEAFLRSYNAAAGKAESQSMSFLGQIEDSDSSDSKSGSDSDDSGDEAGAERVDARDLHREIREKLKEARRKKTRLSDDEDEESQEAIEQQRAQEEKLKRARELGSDDEGDFEVHDRIKKSRTQAGTAAPRRQYGSATQPEEEPHLVIYRAPKVANKDKLEELEDDFTSSRGRGSGGGGGGTGGGQLSSVTSFLSKVRPGGVKGPNSEGGGFGSLKAKSATASTTSSRVAPPKARVLSSLSSRDGKFN